MNKDFKISVTFPDHPKTIKLVRRLGETGPLHLIWFWAWVAANKPTGRLEGMDNEDIAIAARWPGDTDEFVDALVNLRWLDRDGDDLVVHDWAEHNQHASEAGERSIKASYMGYLKNKNFPKAKEVWDANPWLADHMRPGHLGQGDRHAASDQAAQRDACATHSDVHAEGSALLFSSPLDSSEDHIGEPPAGSATGDESGFDEFWRVYPRKVGKGAARKAWIRAIKAAGEAEIIAALRRQVVGWEEKEARFIPHPKTWLNQERWTDEEEVQAEEPELRPPGEAWDE